MRAFFLFSLILVAGLPATRADDAQTLAAQLLDDTLPAPKRQAVIEMHPELAAELVVAMTASLPPEDEVEEYRRIPWIWRVAVAAGKRNEEKTLRALLETSLPNRDEKLRDWQAVVIGGGLINGISLSGKWPRERIEDLLHGHDDLQIRWQQSLANAAAMADDERVKTGTRYDAMRMIALDPAKERRVQLAKYLATGINGELQMGAVSGLSDVEGDEVATLLVSSLKHLTSANRTLALDALLRTDSRRKALQAAVHGGAVSADWLSPEQKQKLGSPPGAKTKQ